MSYGLDAKIPLTYDINDKYYSTIKTIKENAKQQVQMLFLTSPGERMMIPTYGIGVRNFLFEQEPQMLVERIRDQVKKYIPNITIITLETSTRENLLYINFIYLINGFNLKDSFQFIVPIVA